MFRIASFARLAGVSPKVLRDYDARSLFQPAFVDRATGYRMYSPAQLPDLRRIVALRNLGLSLSEIDLLVRDRADLRAMLARRREVLKRERQELEQRLAQLGIELEMATGGAEGLDVVVRDLPVELVATLDAAGAPTGSLERAFYELELRARDANVRAPRPPGALISGGDNEATRQITAFVPVRRGARNQSTLAIRELPRCRAATVLHRGDYSTLPETATSLSQWMVATGLHGSEPMRILYLRFGAESDLRLPQAFLAGSDDEFLTELQIPIR